MKFTKLTPSEVIELLSEIKSDLFDEEQAQSEQPTQDDTTESESDGIMEQLYTDFKSAIFNKQYSTAKQILELVTLIKHLEE